MGVLASARPGRRAPPPRVGLILGLLAIAGTASAQTYNGRDPAAAWRAPAAARIEQLRKGDFTVRVVDDAGQPVANAAVTVTQQRHAFPFGSALQMSRIVQDNASNRLYRQKVAALFNAGTTENDLKWPPWIGEWGASFGRTQTLQGLAWLRDRKYSMRGHVFVWPGWTNLPNAIQALRGTARQNEIPQMVLDHIADEAGATRDLINEWDVQNEPFDNKDLIDIFGAPIQVDWFKAARAALPTAALFLNDYNTEDQTRNAAHVQVFENTARYLQQNNAPLTGLGLQGHIGGSPSGIPDYLATLDRYATSFGLPMRITEFDINTTDEQLQADYTRDFLTASFSHPSVVGFQFWGFWESAHWRPNAAMYRADWTEKPNGAAYRALVYDQWWTRLAGTTNAQGVYRGRGFYGDFVVTAVVNGQVVEKTFSLRSGAAAPEVQLGAAPPRIANLATRAQVAPGVDAPTAGFAIVGETSKLVLVRAVGRGMEPYGVTGTLAAPTLTLYREQTAIAANRRWSTAANAAEVPNAAVQSGGFPLAADDSALLVRLAPGNYTATVTAADGGTGLALVEAYEVERTGSRFANVSTRAFAGRDAALIIPSLFVDGTNARTFLIRGIGPGLADYGVTNLLARPNLVVMSGQTPVAANDGWETSADPAAITAAGIRTGAFALKSGSTDSALVVTLEPGPYTVLVTGADGGTGNCLVEIYEVSR